MLLASISFHQLGYIVNQKHTHTHVPAELQRNLISRSGTQKSCFFSFFFHNTYKTRVVRTTFNFHRAELAVQREVFEVHGARCRDCDSTHK